MDKKRVLISALGTPIFPYVRDILKEKYDLTFVDSDPTVKNIYPGERVYIVPKANDKSFIEVMKKILRENRINYYVPMVDEEISKIVELGEISGLKVIAPNNKWFVDLCLDKYRLMKNLERRGISKIKTYLGGDYKSQFKFPVFVKPRVGRGSRGARKIDNRRQLDAYFKLEGYRPSRVMVQEYVGGVEYSTSVAVNNLNRLIAIVPKRIIRKEGTTRHAVVEHNPAIEETCREIVEILKPRGVFNVQLKIVGTKVKIFEINPRFSGSTPLTCQAGINEIQLCIENYDHKRVKYIDTFEEGLNFYRRWENMFFK